MSYIVMVNTGTIHTFIIGWDDDCSDHRTVMPKRNITLK
jgi:hypothetical protein